MAAHFYPIAHMRRLPMDERVLLWVFIFAFAFDFKGDPGGTFIQFVFAGISMAAGGLCLLYGSFKHRWKHRRVKLRSSLKKLVLIWWGYLLSTLFTALIMGVPLDRYIRVVFPFLLCGISLLIVRNLESRFIDPSEVIRPLVLMALVSTLWTFFYAVSILGLELDIIRYQLLSPAIPFLFAYGFVSLIIRREYSVLVVLSGILPLIMILLSITRSYLISFTLITIGFVWVTPKAQVVRVVKTFARMIAIAPFLVVLAWLAAEQLRPGFAEVWSARLLEHQTSAGLDFTFLTRIAEYSSQWQLLTSSSSSLLFGRGMGSEYWWDESYLVDMPSTKGRPSTWYTVHSMWMYSLYSGGLLFGLIVPGIIIYALWKTQRIVRKPGLITVPRLRGEAALPFFALLAYIGQMFTADPFGFRLSGLLLGFVLGMGYWFYDYSKHSFAFVPVKRYGLRYKEYIIVRHR